MKKKIFSLIATLSLLSSCSVFDQNTVISSKTSTSSSTSSEVKKESVFKYVVNEDGTLKITGFESDNPVSYEDITIPQQIDGKTVTMIAKGAFQGFSTLKKITIPDTVSEIGASAFEGCTLLNDVVIPSSVVTLSDAAFKDCGSLETIIIPDTVLNLGADLFSNCSSLTDVTLPNNDSVTKISNSMFSSCTSLTKITIPENVISIGKQAFSGCLLLEDIHYPTTLLRIESSAFANCKSLSVFDFNEFLTYIGDSAFANCSNLRLISLPKDVVVSSNAFFNCDISKLNLSNLLTTIDSKTLSNYLQAMPDTNYELYIPESVTKIDNEAFNSYSNISAITVDELNKNFSSVDGILYNKDKTELIRCPVGKKTITEIPDTVKTIKSKAFYSCSSLTTISIPNNVETVEANAFENCTSLKQFTMPISVNNVAIAFEGCTSLKEIYCEAPLKPYGWNNSWNYMNPSTTITAIWNTAKNSIVIDGIYYTVSSSDSDHATVTGFAAEQLNVNAEIVENVSIYGKTFTVTEVAKGAFNSCRVFKTLMFAETITTVNESAFDNCIGLEAIIIPKNITTFKSTFNGCTSLVNIYAEASSRPTNFDVNFNKISDNKTIAVKYNFVPISSEDANTGVIYTFNKNYEISVKVNENKKATFSSSFTLGSTYNVDGVVYNITTIEDNGFNGCNRLITLTLPKSVKNFGATSLSNTKINSVTISENVKSIDDTAFNNCSDLKSINVSFQNATYSSIDGILYEKEENDKLRLIKAPEGKTGLATVSNDCIDIAKGAFKNCSKLTRIELAANLNITVLRESVFENCTSLEAPITIPNAVTTIEKAAFKGCDSTNFNKIIIPSLVASIDSDAFSNMSSLTEFVVDEENENFTTYESSLYSKDLTRLVKVPSGKAGVLVLNSELVSFDEYAFEGCSKITKYSITDSKNFYTSSNLGVLYSADKTTLYACPQGSSADIVCESATTTIKKGAFKNCNLITRIEFNTNLKTIENNTEFYGLTNLNYLSLNSAGLEYLYINAVTKNIESLSWNNIETIYLQADCTSESMKYLAFLSKGKGSYDVLVDPNNPSYLMENGILYGKTNGSKNNYIHSSVCSSRYTGKFAAPTNIYHLNVQPRAFAYTKYTKFFFGSNVTYVGHDILIGITTEEEAKNITFYVWYSSAASCPSTWHTEFHKPNVNGKLDCTVVYNYTLDKFNEL